MLQTCLHNLFFILRKNPQIVHAYLQNMCKIELVHDKRFQCLTILAQTSLKRKLNDTKLDKMVPKRFFPINVQFKVSLCYILPTFFCIQFWFLKYCLHISCKEYHACCPFHADFQTVNILIYVCNYPWDIKMYVKLYQNDKWQIF